MQAAVFFGVFALLEEFAIMLLEDSPTTLLDEFWAISLLDVPTASLLSGAGPTDEQLSPYTGEAVNESEEVSSEQATTPNNKVGIIPQRILLNIQHSLIFYYKL
jgi:hypothetical protein